MSVCRSVHSVSAVLAANAHRDINLPRNAREINDTKEGVYALAGFPGVVGAIDGSLVPIIAPSDNEPVYVCRKGYHAINVQGIADANLLFTNIVARWPGGTHDAYVLLNSEVYVIFEAGVHEDGWSLGDSGYPSKPWLLVPKLDPQTRAEQAYNRSHIKTRNVVERTFGVWKMRFRCLHKSSGHLSCRPNRRANVIVATARFHNKCVRARIGPPADDDVADNHDGDDNADQGDGQEKRHDDDGPADGRNVRERLIATVLNNN